MPISRSRKEEIVAQFVEQLGQNTGFAIVRTRGLSVPRVQALRKAVRDAGGVYMVGKNTLFTKALEQAGWTIPEDLLQGPTAIAMGNDNFPAIVKALLNFIKDQNLEEDFAKVTGGVLGQQEIFNADGVDRIANLPTLPELQSQILGLLVTPAMGLVNVLQQADAGVVNVLQAWIQKQEDEGAA